MCVPCPSLGAEFLMKRYYVLAFALSAGVAFAAAPLAVSAKSASFDGTWNVRLVTEAGTCDSSYSQTVAIENGRVRPVAGATSISGGVGTDGSVALTIAKSIATADARGRLTSKSGAGSWNLAMLGCTGRWTASRA
jgi:hypothetical protein